MLSRVANSIFWANRYIERAENYARFIDVNFNLSLDLTPDLPEQWGPLVITTGDWDLFKEFHENPTRENVIYFLTFDKNNPNSILNCIHKGRENARTFRESITREIWEQINNLYFLVNEGFNSKIWTKNRASRDFFHQIRNDCQLIYGIEESTISRMEGWHFGCMGRYLERADKTSRLLDVKYHYILPSVKLVGTTLDMLHWTALLKSVSAFNMYRRAYGKIVPQNIVEFLLMNRYFPRSIWFSINQAEKSLAFLSDHPVNGNGTNPAAKKMGMLRSEIEFADINDIFMKGLHEHLDETQKKINQISDTIYTNFFTINPQNSQQQTTSDSTQTQSQSSN